MMIIFQLILYCLLFTAMVRYSVRGGAINGLYFYPKAVQERAYEIGLTDRETVKKQRKRFMTLFYIVMLTALVIIIAVRNGVSDFRTAYLQSLLFLEVMNIYDGIMSKARYGDMQEFVNELYDEGYEVAELIDTTEGMFMTSGEAKMLGFSGSSLLIGRK